jgi:integrase
MGTVKDGVVKRGNTWSFVIRVTNHATGASHPRWVGGFRSEGEAKARAPDMASFFVWGQGWVLTS